LFELPDGAKILWLAPEFLDDLRHRAELVERLEFEHFHALDLGNACVGVLVEQQLQHLAGGAAVFGEVVALLDLLGPLPAGEWLLAEGDVANE